MSWYATSRKKIIRKITEAVSISAAIDPFSLIGDNNKLVWANEIPHSLILKPLYPFYKIAPKMSDRKEYISKWRNQSLIRKKRNRIKKFYAFFSSAQE